MLNTIRSLVSENRCRYIDHEHNLDLSYVTDRIIAMSFPSEGIAGLYRNSLHEVKQFLDKRHGGHYMIFNLCSEREYDATKFGVPVANYPFDDHQSPPFSFFQRFCSEADAWLRENSSNVVVVHCKAGKGRTGTMVAALLLYLGEVKTADQAMQVYGRKRTSDGKGVTIPSQQRYVHYFELMLREGAYSPKNIRISRMVIHSIPTSYKHGRDVAFKIYNNATKVYDQHDKNLSVTRTSKSVIIDTLGMAPVNGDVHIMFQRAGVYWTERVLCHFWFNTAFHSQPISLRKNEIDGAFQDETCKEFDSDFKIEILFE